MILSSNARENGTKTIVIAEDEPQIANIVKYKLEKSGYNVLWGENGRKALEILNENDADLVILDLMMPVMDGFEVLKNLKSNQKTKDIPVIILTAKRMEEDVLKGFDLGAEDYVIKPFSVSEVLARVRRIIGD